MLSPFSDRNKTIFPTSVTLGKEWWEWGSVGGKLRNYHDQMDVFELLLRCCVVLLPM